MRKLVSIFLLVLYTFSVSAAVIDNHYCGGVLSGVSIKEAATADCCCSMDTMEMPPIETAESLKVLSLFSAPRTSQSQNLLAADNCCSEQIVLFQLVKDQLRSSDQSSWDQGLLSAALPSPFLLQPFLAPVVTTNRLLLYTNSKGVSPDIPLYKLFRRLTYYG